MISCRAGRITCASIAAAAIRFALPSRSTDRGETRPGPASPWTADTTMLASASAERMLLGSLTSAVTISISSWRR
jgi:hypothetical protein